MQSKSLLASSGEAPKLLNYNQCLVYVENTQPFSDVDGTTQIARVVRTPVTTDSEGATIQWYELELITDSEGDRLEKPQPIVVSEDRIVSNRSKKDILLRQFYNFASLTNSFENGGDIQYPLAATNFVIKDRSDSPLESTSRSALGSGIYGIYLSDESMIPHLLTDENQITYLIDCPNAYIIQDKEHGESITVASLNTNRYLDRVIPALQSDDSIKPLDFIQMNPIHNLWTLWNIVLYRTNQHIAQDRLEQVLANYVVHYLSDPQDHSSSYQTLVDSINGNALHELPINAIMRELGHDGIIGDDPYTNSWDRGCVSYNYDQAVIIQGSLSRY